MRDHRGARTATVMAFATAMVALSGCLSAPQGTPESTASGIAAPQGTPESRASTIVVSEWEVASVLADQSVAWTKTNTRVIRLAEPGTGAASTDPPIEGLHANLVVETFRTNFLQPGFPEVATSLAFLVESSGVVAHVDATLDVVRYHRHGAFGIGHKWEAPVMHAVEHAVTQAPLATSSGPLVEGCQWKSPTTTTDVALCLDGHGAVAYALDRQEDHLFVARPVGGPDIQVEPRPPTQEFTAQPSEPWRHVAAPDAWVPPFPPILGGPQRLESIVRSALTVPGFATHLAAGQGSSGLLTAFMQAVDGLAGTTPAMSVALTNEHSRLDWLAYEVVGDPAVHVAGLPSTQREVSLSVPSTPPPVVPLQVVLQAHFPREPELLGWRVLVLGDLAPLWVFGDACLGQGTSEYGIASAVTGQILLFGRLNRVETQTSTSCAVMYPEARAVPTF